MGKFKPLLLYQDKSFIQNIVLKLSSVCDKIIIVTGFKAGEVKGNVNKLKLQTKVQFVFNKSYEKGMFTSLQTGINAAKISEWVLYHFVDQPGLPEKFYKDFIDQIDDVHNWIQPSYKKQSGHPVLIHKSLFDLISNASAESSLREISKNPLAVKRFWVCEYSVILQDIDTEDDLTFIKNRKN